MMLTRRRSPKNLISPFLVATPLLLASVVGCSPEQATVAVNPASLPKDAARQEYPESAGEVALCASGSNSVNRTGSYTVRTYVAGFPCSLYAPIVKEVAYSGSISRDFWYSDASTSTHETSPVQLPGGLMPLDNDHTWSGSFAGRNCVVPTDKINVTINTEHSTSIFTDPNNSNPLEYYISLPVSRSNSDPCEGPPATMTLPSTVVVGSSVTATTNCVRMAHWTSNNWSAAYPNGMYNYTMEIVGQAVGTATISALCLGSGAARSASATITVIPSDYDECELDPATRVRSLSGGGVALNYEDCDGGEAPTPPMGGRGEDGNEVCYPVYRELWEYNYGAQDYEMTARWYLGSVCYLNGNMT